MAHYHRLSALDRSFLDLEGPDTHMHVAGTFLFDKGPLSRPDGGVDIERIREYVHSRLHLIPRYRQRIARIPLENHPVWVDDERFNLQYHVRHTALPPPGDDRQLKRLCGRIVSQQLDRGKPLWEFWIVEGLEHDRLALLAKAHHCMVDGISGMDLLQVLLRPTPEKEFEPAPGWYPRPRPGGLSLARDAALRRAGLPLRALGGVTEAVRDPARLRRSLGEMATGVPQTLAQLRPASETPLNQEIGPHRRFDWLAFDLAEVKRVKDVLGGTVNDVVLATVAGAVGRFLARRGVSEADQRDLDFRAFCPVSTRARDERGALGNRVSSMVARIPIDERDPRRRLHRVTETMGKLKDARQSLGAELLAALADWTEPALMSWVTRQAFAARSSNLVVTNVPGPQIPLYLLGARMLECYPVVPLFVSQGLAVGLFSYAGGLYWGLTADWDLFPDLHELVIALDESFRELCDAADEAG